VARFFIREANENDIPGIAQLRLKIKEFQSIEIEEYILFWKSLIKDNPCSIKKALVAVDDQNIIVAHYAMVPFKFLKDRESLLGGFVCQLMVAEDYRQELLFPKIVLKMLKEYKDLGVDFAYSLSNRLEVVKAHQAFGFCKIGILAVYARPYKLTNIAHHFIKSNILNMIIRPGLSIVEKALRLRKSSGKRDLAVTEIYNFDSSIDRFTATVQRFFPYAILRDSSILNWRTVDSPARKYQLLVAKEEGNIVGYVILRRMIMKQFDVLAIVDILFSPERFDVGKSLLNAAHDRALQLNVDMSTCLFNPYDPLCPVLKKCGYFKTPETFSLFVHEPKGKRPNFSKASFDKWHLTWFDHDSV
jgi:predicted N-acetyltransferase YhbS